MEWIDGIRCTDPQVEAKILRGPHEDLESYLDAIVRVVTFYKFYGPFGDRGDLGDYADYYYQCCYHLLNNLKDIESRKGPQRFLIELRFS
ncbi:hypothetical protein BVRB_1g008120 isoform B [Beta vulgaris subsp. vulgaris]|nr:hypothetical protein BVRB_1g008120 isoform B [Beta vulgaris subsp. vulgaris]